VKETGSQRALKRFFQVNLCGTGESALVLVFRDLVQFRTSEKQAEFRTNSPVLAVSPLEGGLALVGEDQVLYLLQYSGELGEIQVRDRLDLKNSLFGMKVTRVVEMVPKSGRLHLFFNRDWLLSVKLDESQLKVVDFVATQITQGEML